MDTRTLPFSRTVMSGIAKFSYEVQLPKTEISKQEGIRHDRYDDIINLPHNPAGQLLKFPARSKNYLPQTERSLWQMGIVQQSEILPNKLKSGTLFACMLENTTASQLEIPENFICRFEYPGNA